MAGPAFAALADPAAAWPAPPNRLGGPNRFLGYRLDARQQPTFRYQIGGVTVEEFPQPKRGEVDLTLLRELTLDGSGDLWFRVASGKLTALPGGTYDLDGHLKIRLSNVAETRIVNDELRARVTARRTGYSSGSAYTAYTAAVTR